MATITQEILILFSQPEYLVLLISVTAITANVYISHRNRKYALAKEEYFKLQQVVEKIMAKLVILESHRRKLKTFFELSHLANKNKNGIFIDANDTFNRTDFEKDGGDITALLYIYFPALGEDWNLCLTKMSDLFTLVLILDQNIRNGKTIDWKKEAETHNKASQELGSRPKEIADNLKKELMKFKEAHL